MTRKRKYALKGQRIGSLIAVEECETKYPGVVGWRCVCDCGNECVKTTRQLTSVLNGQHKTISCGCNRNRGEDLTGRRFGRLLVLERASNYGNAMYKCACDCGAIVEARALYLLAGKKQSCGCLEDENRRAMWKHSHNGRAVVYGEQSRRYNERLYNVWNAMKSRCNNPKVACFKNYGGRGITVCDEWQHSFPAFRKWALESGYDENAIYGECTIDRIDVNGNYEPSNCRWVDMKVQGSNRRQPLR